jgi:hypothetical protein
VTTLTWVRMHVTGRPRVSTLTRVCGWCPGRPYERDSRLRVVHRSSLAELRATLRGGDGGGGDGKHQPTMTMSQYINGPHFDGYRLDDFLPGKVGRCRLTVSKPELKARLVSALETKM